MDIDASEIQGNILRGYGHGQVRYLVLEVTDRAAARRFLKAAVEAPETDPIHIRREGDGTKKWPKGQRPESCFNIGLTAAGLRALGLSEAQMATFPREFRDGMVPRAMKLGDFGDSAPENWMAPFGTPGKVHVIASVYADGDGPLDVVQGRLEAVFRCHAVLNGARREGGKVFFGYKDGIAQPRLKGWMDQDPDPVEGVPVEPLGTVLLGHDTVLEGLRFGVPQPDVLGRNGTFDAFRVLAQDVKAFEDYLDNAAEQLEEQLAELKNDRLLLPENIEEIFGQGWTRRQALREIVAAQMCGRWRNGVPFHRSPTAPDPKEGVSEKAFDYDFASRCPAGAHIRRTNPRGGPIVQRIANYTRHMMRRGMPYEMRSADGTVVEQGLLGNFIGASLGAQFEAVMCDWLNTGLQDPDITGSNDPLIGANAVETSWFYMTTSDPKVFLRIHKIPRFVKTRGGAYTFLPSLPAIRYLAGLTG